MLKILNQTLVISLGSKISPSNIPGGNKPFKTTLDLALHLSMSHEELRGKHACGNNLFLLMATLSFTSSAQVAQPNCNFSRKPLLTRLILSFNLLHMLDFQRKYLFYNLFWIFLLEIGKLCFICYDLLRRSTFTVNHWFYIEQLCCINNWR